MESWKICQWSEVIVYIDIIGDSVNDIYNEVNLRYDRHKMKVKLSVIDKNLELKRLIFEN